MAVKWVISRPGRHVASDGKKTLLEVEKTGRVWVFRKAGLKKWVNGLHTTARDARAAAEKLLPRPRKDEEE